MKKYLILLFLTLCIFNFSVKSQESIDCEYSLLNIKVPSSNSENKIWDFSFRNVPQVVLLSVTFEIKENISNIYDNWQVSSFSFTDNLGIKIANFFDSAYDPFNKFILQKELTIPERKILNDFFQAMGYEKKLIEDIKADLSNYSNEEKIQFVNDIKISIGFDNIAEEFNQFSSLNNNKETVLNYLNSNIIINSLNNKEIVMSLKEVPELTNTFKAIEIENSEQINMDFVLTNFGGEGTIGFRGICKKRDLNKRIIAENSTKKITNVVNVTNTNQDKKSLKEELKYWKELFEDELITQAEYDAKRKELLSGSSVTSTTTVAEPKVEKKKVVEQTTVVENNTNTIDLSFKDKNYINRSLLDKMGFFSNDGKIKDYCENKYPKLHVYMECYAQNVKKYRNYKRAAAVYDLYIDYGRYLAWEAMIGNMSESSARYQLSTKRKELGDAYAADSRDKWNRIADSIEQLRKTHESFQPKPIYGSGESTNVCMYNAEKEAMKICKRKRSNGTCASFSNQGC